MRSQLHCAELQLHLFLKAFMTAEQTPSAVNWTEVNSILGRTVCQEERARERHPGRERERQTRRKVCWLYMWHKNNNLQLSLSHIHTTHSKHPFQVKVNYSSGVNKVVQYFIFVCFLLSKTTQVRVDSLFHFLFAGPHLPKSLYHHSQHSSTYTHLSST